MNMQWSLSRRIPEEQEAWSIFIGGVIFDDFCREECFTKFLHPNVPCRALGKRVLRKLKRVARNLLLEFGKLIHRYAAYKVNTMISIPCIVPPPHFGYNQRRD